MNQNPQKPVNKFKEINFNPFNNNPLDYIDSNNLYTVNNEKITLKHDLKFKIYIDNELKLITDSNVQACAFLNKIQSGMKG